MVYAHLQTNKSIGVINLDEMTSKETLIILEDNNNQKLCNYAVILLLRQHYTKYIIYITYDYILFCARATLLCFSVFFNDAQ